jgi:two-component system nitrogen regulation response regulator GlnG
MSSERPGERQSGEVLVLGAPPEQWRRLGEALARAAASGAYSLSVTSPEDAEQLIGRLLGGVCESYVSGGAQGGLYRHVMRLVDRSLVEAGLRRAGGCQVRAARLLGISRNTLRAKMRGLGIRA